MSELFASLQTIVTDHVRLSLMNQIRNGESTSMSKLISVALLVGAFSWAYEFISGEGQKSFRDIICEWRSFIQRKNVVLIEGRHVTGIDNYSRRPITLANTFSKNFRAILFHIVQNIDDLSDVRELKEFATNFICGYAGSLPADKSSSDDVKTIFTVSQKTPFLLDTKNEIYCTVKEMGEQREETSPKIESRVIKFQIAVFSYKTKVGEIKEFVKRLKNEYTKHLEEKRKDRLFVYTLNNVEVNNDDDEDTVGGWQETTHETMKSFDNIFFDGKREVLQKIDFFVNNKDWYKRNGIPYTLGIGLYGPPGTGKTSFIKALATLLGRHIVSMSLSRIKTKKQLQDFYYETQYSSANDKNAVGFDKKIVVFEDIDCIGDLVLKRKQKSAGDTDSSSDLEDGDDFEMNDVGDTGLEAKLKNEIGKAAKRISKKLSSSNAIFNGPAHQENLTLDDLLNLWDGIRENTGRIMIITTNHYDKLDPALIRPGRIDLALHLEHASLKTIAEMYEHYYGSQMDPNDLEIIPDRFYSPAEVINFYVSNHQNPRGFIERLASKKKI